MRTRTSQAPPAQPLPQVQTKPAAVVHVPPFAQGEDVQWSEDTAARMSDNMWLSWYEIRGLPQTR